MTRRSLLRAIAAVSAVAAGLVLQPFHVTAAPPSETGWWWRAQAGVGTVLPSPPNVPAGGLLVAGEPEGATAVSAVRFQLGEDESQPVVTLKVASDQGGAQAVMAACHTSSAWQPTSNGNWTTRPIADCRRGSVPGVRATDGLAWSFAVDSLVDNGAADIVLVPGTVAALPAGANGSTFSIAFERPGEESVVTQQGSGEGDTGEVGGPPPFDPSTAPSFGGDFGFPPGAVPLPGDQAPFQPFAPALPEAGFGGGPPVTTAPAAVTDDGGAPRAFTSPASLVPASSPRRAPAVGILLVALCAIASMGSWGVMPAPRSLVPGRRAATDASAGGAAVADPGATGGLGRFAKQRVGQPPPL